MKSLILLFMAFIAVGTMASSYHQPVEIVQNNGKELILQVNKGILEESENSKSTDFILYYNVEFNKDLDALERVDKKKYLAKMRHNFTIGDSCRDKKSEDECIKAIEKYTINLEAGKSWRTIKLPITKRGKYTIHFYREGVYGRSTNDVTIAKIAGEDNKIASFINKSFGFISGKSANKEKDVAFYPIWKQDIFVQPENETNQDLIDEIAKKYAPVSFMHSEEEYLPTSLEYMANEVDVDPILAEEMFQLTLDPVLKGKGVELKRGREIVFPYKDLKKVLPYNSDNLMVLSSKLGKKKTRLRFRKGSAKDATVYYSFMENKQLNQAYLNYHFLFPFDPKTGTAQKPALPAHTFDRESMTIILDLDTLEPNRIIYGAHLPNQLMGLLGDIMPSTWIRGIQNWIKNEPEEEPSKLQTWLGGRVSLEWSKVLKIKNNHPIIVMAQGSHGIYPTKGDYVVAMDFGKEVDTLTEGANGEQILYPNSLEFSSNSKATTAYLDYKKKTSYKIKNLELDRITSKSWNNILSFSGDTVDVLGPMNAKFPPYTGREYDIESYVNGDPCMELIDGQMTLIDGSGGCYTDGEGVMRKPIYKWDVNKVQVEKQQRLIEEIEILNSIMYVK